jgi:hypothetical protein
MTSRGLAKIRRTQVDPELASALTRRLTVAIVLAVATSATYAQRGGPEGLLRQKLNSQFPLTRIAADRSSVTSAGALLVLQKGGLMMYGTVCPSSPLTVYKKGKLSQPFGATLRRDTLGTMKMPGHDTTSSCPRMTFPSGTRLWVTTVAVQNDGILFRLYSDQIGDQPYYGDLKFQLAKDSVPEPDEALRIIAEVLTVKPAESAGGSPGPVGAVQPPNGVPGPAGADSGNTAPALTLPASYANAQAPGDQLRLNADHTFTLQEGGQNYRGTFAVTGNAVELDITETNTKTTATIQGNSLIDASGQTWTLHDAAASTAAEDVLRNQDIIALTQAGFDESTILTKIANSQCQFDTSTAALVQLKKAGVSAAVIKAVITSAASPKK